MAVDIIYEILKKDIIRSYTSGDFDNSLNQLDTSLHTLVRLYDKRKFQSVKDFEKEKTKLLTEVQGIVDQQVFRKMYGEN